MPQLTIDEIKRLTFEERLYELAKELPAKRRLKLQEYFELFEWANLLYSSLATVPEALASVMKSAGFYMASSSHEKKRPMQRPSAVART